MMAQPSHSISEFNNNDTLRLCQDNPMGFMLKDPLFEGTPFWINGLNEMVHADSIIITHDNAGWILYIEKENQTYKNLFIMFQPLPNEGTHEIWLEEGETQFLKATPHEIPTFEYEWTSNIWPSDSTYNAYELPVSRPGIYYCFVNDQCHTAVIITFIVNQSPGIRFINTNIGTNTNRVHWDYYENSFYDTLYIFRNGEFAGSSRFDWEMWIDPEANNSNGPVQYTVSAIKNGEVLTGPSKWKTGISLQINDINEETVRLTLTGPADEDGTPVENLFQFYQLYSKESNGWGLLQSMIPTTTTELEELNIFDTLIIAGVTWENHEIYSNMVFPTGSLTKCEEHFEKVQVFPNPVTNGILYVTAKNADYRIINLHGQQIKSGHCSQRLDISDLPSGVYTIEVKEKQSTTTINTIKFIVE